MKKILLLIVSINYSLFSQEYKIPPEVIKNLVEADPQPTLNLNNKGTLGLIIKRDGYQSISDLAKDELRIAGTRLDPVRYTSSRMAYYKSFSLIDIKSANEIDVNYPENGRFSYFTWSPDEKKIAYTNTTDDGVELWVLDIDSRKSSRLSDVLINDINVKPFQWFNSSNDILISLRCNEEKPIISKIPSGPIIQETNNQNAPSRTYQDLIKNKNEEILFEHFSCISLVKVSLDLKEVSLIKKGMIKEYDLSPDNNFLMTKTINKPFSYLVPYYRFPTEYRVYNVNGDLVKVIQDTPLTEELPKGRMSTTTEPRNIGWRNDLGASLYFFKALDKGDPENKIEFRDALFQWDYPFNNEPQLILKVNNRLSNVVWGNNDIAIATDIWWNNRNVKTYLFNPSNTSKKALVIENRNYQDIYSDPGNFLMKNSKYNTKVLDIKNNSAFLIGSGFTENGQFPFVDKLNLEKNSKQRLYQSSFTKKYENILDYDPGKKIAFVRIESPKEFPNYYFRDVSLNKLKRITFFKNPFKALEKVKKEIITYKREDGLDLSGVLYLPEDASVGDKKPMILWAYPREYKDKSTASQKRSNPNTFTYPSMRNPIYWATQGYVVLDRAEFPIVGEGDEEPNDSFRKQLVANGKAAIDAVDKMGFIDRERVGVGGHSYGAFMVANLLSHSNLFAAGIARSGAYNRTLTPFGFQSEERSYWEAPDVYYSMSPFMHANKMKTPLLLVHGEEDNNSGTYPLQSVRYFNALKGLGATTRLVMFPKESHGYRAKESILHLIWEQDRWLDMHVKNKKKKLVKEKNKPKG